MRLGAAFSHRDAAGLRPHLALIDRMRLPRQTAWAPRRRTRAMGAQAEAESPAEIAGGRARHSASTARGPGALLATIRRAERMLTRVRGSAEFAGPGARMAVGGIGDVEVAAARTEIAGAAGRRRRGAAAGVDGRAAIPRQLSAPTSTAGLDARERQSAGLRSVEFSTATEPQRLRTPSLRGIALAGGRNASAGGHRAGHGERARRVPAGLTGNVRSLPSQLAAGPSRRPLMALAREGRRPEFEYLHRTVRSESGTGSVWGAEYRVTPSARTTGAAGSSGPAGRIHGISPRAASVDRRESAETSGGTRQFWRDGGNVPVAPRAANTTPGLPTSPPAETVGVSASKVEAAAMPGASSNGDSVLDGARVARWLARALAADAARPPAAGAGFDPRRTPAWAPSFYVRGA